MGASVIVFAHVCLWKLNQVEVSQPLLDKSKSIYSQIEQLLK